MPAYVRIAVAVAVAMAATGCPVGVDPPPPIPDGPPGVTGLSITWQSRPAQIPGAVSPDLTITSATFEQDDLRIAGEAGTFQLDRDELEWSGGVAPAELPVVGAAPGLYARLSFELEGDEEEDEYAYEITGTVRVGGEDRPFTIRDTSSFELALDFSISLPAGGTVMIPVHVDLDELVNAVDFDQLQPDNGKYLVDRTSSQISAVRAAVNGAFGVSGAM